MAGFNLKDYEEVKDRIPQFYDKYEDGRIVTRLEWHNDDLTHVCVYAMLYKGADDQADGSPLATGYAEERKGQDGMANKAAWLENCETSAIGRALANAGLSGSKSAKRPSREEMAKVERLKDEPEKPKDAATEPQRKMMFAIAKEAGVSHDDLKAWIAENVGKDSTSELTRVEATKIIEYLKDVLGGAS